MEMLQNYLQPSVPDGWYTGTITVHGEPVKIRRLPWKQDVIVGVQIQDHVGVLFALHMVPNAGLSTLLGREVEVRVGNHGGNSTIDRLMAVEPA